MGPEFLHFGSYPLFLHRPLYVLSWRMNDSNDTAPEAGDGPGQALVPADTAEAVFDAHGHDPSDYQWVPVLRRPRSDGWTPQRQVDFIAALADRGCVAEAARQVGMSVTSCYRLRRSPGGENFAAAWDAALPFAARKLADLAFDRAIHGSDEPVFDKEGRRVGRRMRQNDRLLMFLLRAYMPERFRYAHRDVREPHEPEPPAAPPLAEALGRLDPVAPAAPHLLMAPDQLDCALEVADICDGRLPHWHRYRVDPEPEDSPLDDNFERALEAAKSEASSLPPDTDDDPFLG